MGDATTYSWTSRNRGVKYADFPCSANALTEKGTRGMRGFYKRGNWDRVQRPFDRRHKA